MKSISRKGTEITPKTHINPFSTGPFWAIFFYLKKSTQNQLILLKQHIKWKIRTVLTSWQAHLLKFFSIRQQNLTLKTKGVAKRTPPPVLIGLSQCGGRLLIDTLWPANVCIETIIHLYDGNKCSVNDNNFVYYNTLKWNLLHIINPILNGLWNLHR